MALLVYKFSNYENTAEREQYRSLCKKLKSFYGKSDELCIFIANFNIYDCELDGIIIKQDAIIAVEFKNYKGEVIAVDNGEWKLSGGTIIKGGSRKTVYQQANLNHVAIKRGFKDGNIVEPKQVKNVAAIVVFHQPITLVNNLSPKTQSWLHVCDESDFLAKVQDITSKSTDLSLEQMLTIIERLNLTQDYLDKTYSNKDFFENLPTKEQETETIIKENAENIHPQDENILKDSSNAGGKIEIITDKAEQNAHESEEIESLSRYIDQILSVILKNRNYKKNIFKSELAQSLFDEHDIKLSTEYVVIIQGDNIKDSCKRLSRFMNRDVRALQNDFIYWEIETGRDTDDFIEDKNDDKINLPSNMANHSPNFRKSSTILPHWLDCFLFNNLKATYSPFGQRFEYNMDLNSDEVRIYLGTYFPRSYAEMFCIVENLMQNETIRNLYQSKNRITIFDFGCGTGGELIGLMTAMAKYNIKYFDVVAYDGNAESMKTFQRIVSQFESKQNANVKIQSINKPINTIIDFDTSLDLDRAFDFVLCDKMICELISKKIITNNAYSIVASKLLHLINNNGLLILLDVTTKDSISGYFYPQLMNKQLNLFIAENNTYSTLLPIACGCRIDCSVLCFMQQQFTISHSRKQKDLSKVCYRVLTTTNFKEQIFGEVPTNANHIIHPERFLQGEQNATCSKLVGDTYIDSFNINYK